MAFIADLSLTPLSLLYSSLMRARNALYDQRILQITKISAPVISVGNITTGGTGKTPLVQWIAREVAAAGFMPCVLTRGYGRRTRASERVVVSDGHRLLADAQRGGDEPRLLAENLLGIAAVIADADRIRAARWAIEHLGSGAFLLDDGYQHRGLARTLDIAVVDATNPWSNYWTLPRGRLRESLSALNRADCVVITRSEQAEKLKETIREATRLSRKGVPVLASSNEITGIRSLQFDNQQLASPDYSPSVGAFCGIGNPRSFFQQLVRGGHQVVWTREFRDHYYYTQNDINELCAEAARLNISALLTTAKDAVKLNQLQFSMPCFAVDIELRFPTTDQQILSELIKRAIGA